MRIQRCYQGRRQRLHEQALGHLRPDQDKKAVTTVLAGIVVPGQARLLERGPDCPVQALTDRYLITVSPAAIPETLNVENNDRPVNGPVLVHLPSHAKQGARHRSACGQIPA